MVMMVRIPCHIDTRIDVDEKAGWAKKGPLRVSDWPCSMMNMNDSQLPGFTGDLPWRTTASERRILRSLQLKLLLTQTKNSRRISRASGLKNTDDSVHRDDIQDCQTIGISNAVFLWRLR